jgi:membrane associated rhomboid family serine protease
VFIRNEPFKRFLKDYPMTTAILAANIVVFLFLYLLLKLPSTYALGDRIFSFMVASNAAILGGAWWQVLTAVFLHTTFEHILFNAFAILIFAPALEAMLGSWRFLCGYLCTGVAANVIALFIEPSGFGHYGASGAVFGLWGIYLYLILFRGERMNREDRTILLVTLAVSLIYSFLGIGIDAKGHLTGLLTGLLIAPILFSRRTVR